MAGCAYDWVFDFENWIATTGRPKPATTKTLVATPHFNFAFLICTAAINGSLSPLWVAAKATEPTPWASYSMLKVLDRTIEILGAHQEKNACFERGRTFQASYMCSAWT